MPYAARPFAVASSFQPIEFVRAGWPGWTAGLGAGVLVVCDPETVYRPRHPERTVFYKVLEQHFDRYVYAYEERFEPRSGPLRPRRLPHGGGLPRVCPARGRLRPHPVRFLRR